MTHSVSHFLSDHFPDLDQQAYQSALEKIGFLTVAAMLVGAFTVGVVLVLRSGEGILHLF